MCNSRKSGDLFEYKFAKYLCAKGLIFNDDYSKNKFINLQNKITQNNNININNIDIALNEIFKFKHLKNYKIIKFTKDTNGKKGNISDIEIYDDYNKCIGFSCKVNNISIKHQRPSSLYRQTGMNKEDCDIFKKEYKICNDKWFNIIKQYITFNKINYEEKIKMYKEFNNIIIQYLNKLSEIEIQKFYNFLINYEKVYLKENLYYMIM
jgi:hypothetical protein